MRTLTVLDPEFSVELSGIRVGLGWMLVAFLVTFVVTRLITRSIHRGSSAFKDTKVGGIHIHHQVYGIFLLLIVGTAEFTYRPESPWSHVLAALFGVGAALTLDEFALWLRLDDVYWTTEGRRSVDAVLVAAVIGVLLVLGANPLGDQSGTPAITVAATVVTNLSFALVAILKGRILLGLIGVLLPFVALIAAIRVARPASPWARRFYRPHSWRWQQARLRFPVGRRGRWDRLIDMFALAPAAKASPVPEREGKP